MNEEVNSLNELDGNSSPEKPIQPTEPKIDNLGRSYATGRRKDSTARVWVKRGSGVMTVNGKEMPIYFDRPIKINWHLFAVHSHDTRTSFYPYSSSGIFPSASSIRSAQIINLRFSWLYWFFWARITI